MTSPLNVDLHLDELGEDAVVLIEGIDISPYIAAVGMSYDPEDGCLIRLDLKNCAINRVPRGIPHWMEQDIEEVDEEADDPGT